MSDETKVHDTDTLISMLSVAIEGELVGPNLLEFLRQATDRLKEYHRLISAMPADWSQDKRLVTWFPYNWEKMRMLEDTVRNQLREIEELRKEAKRVAHLAQYWDSQGDGAEILGVFYENVTGSFRDAIDVYVHKEAQEEKEEL